MTTQRTLFGSFLGGLLALLSGVVIDGGLWLWAFASVLSGDGAVTIGPIVHASAMEGSATTVSGPGLLIVPVGLALVGAVLAWLISRRSATGTRAAEPRR
ncbi:hypothetical protein GA0004736_1141 [Curtobacterium sp. 9128]|uniref:hypothetical protein n=1 Tax=Curtobacterium sp. 9128 TaxID=1793722 RepID=UPI0007D7325E|nr:hypothetical protein [Curtobacterium sp. 9128]SBN62241.1 hypothetical protein GA0004736_1141 [Curtobacterium sp. 9128]